MKLIDKEKLVDEINRRLSICNKVALDLRNVENKDYYPGKAESYKEILDMLNTIEVKEVDLEKESMNYLLNEHKSPLNYIMHQVDLKTEMQYQKDIQDAFKAGFIKAVEG